MSLKEENNSNKRSENNKETRRLFRVIIALLVIVILLLILNCCMYSKCASNQLVVDCNSEAIDVPKPHISDDGSEMTEIVGYENVLVNVDNQNIYIVNPKNNTVYLQYDIYYNNELIHSTDLIPPDRMVEVNVYDLLDRGEVELLYEIDSFDLKTQEECLSNITQIVKVKVEK